MNEQIVAIYASINDILKSIDHQEDHQCRMSDSEVITLICQMVKKSMPTRSTMIMLWKT